MKLFDDMQRIIEALAEKGRLFQGFKDDFYVIDRDILENDSQRGDMYIWSITPNGTSLNFLDGSDVSVGTAEAVTSPTTYADTAFFVVRCSGINEGTVEPIARDAVVSFARKARAAEGRVPRRVRLVTQVQALIHTLARLPLAEYVRGIAKGDVALLRVSGGGMVKDVHFLSRDGGVNCRLNAGAESAPQNGVWRLEATGGGYGVIKPTAEAVFTRALGRATGAKTNARAQPAP